MNEFYHSGVAHDENPPGRGSGRYPWGSGKRPHQSKNDYKYKLNYSKIKTKELANDFLLLFCWPYTMYTIFAKTANAIRYENALNDGRDYYSYDGPYEDLENLKKINGDHSFDDDLKKVNKYKKDYGGVKNCMFTVTAMEMRRRGYDVIARRTSQGKSIHKLEDWFKGTSIEKVTFFKKEDESNASYHNRSYDQILRYIERQGEGARGVLSVGWEKVYSGHVMYYEVKNGSVTLSDPQSGSKDITKNMMAEADAGSYEVIRLDNLKPSNNITTAIISNKEKGGKKK